LALAGKSPAERKRQFSQPSLDPICLDVRKRE